MTSEPTDMPEDDALAAEFALGLLEGGERAAFAKRLREDRALAAKVTYWQAHFAGDGSEIEDLAPPPRVKTKLMQAIAPEGARKKGGWLGLRGLFGGLALAGCVALAVFLMQPPADGFAPQYHADIAAQDETLLLTALYDPEHSLLEVTVDAGAAPTGRVLELWAIVGEAAPVSLGVLNADGPSRLTLTEAMAAGLTTATLAVSEEPPGGSPDAGPSGAVLAAGAVTAL
ncbi:anti-sigma factor [Alphaproteobacteria bacterium KMM 3653]|uniref:Anti-sigma factor n=1 Tax=Harenicola maris TaxID=2841044 RepID=A0AAP2G8C1_9RHOB|nr:anti-sigma factor [Harenicola maris]